MEVEVEELNAKQIQSNIQLKRILIWSVSMTAINQMKTALLVLYSFFPNEWVFAATRFDDVINVWTSWLMITRNRQLLDRISRGTLERVRRMSMPTTLTEMNSANPLSTNPNTVLEEHQRKDCTLVVK